MPTKTISLICLLLVLSCTKEKKGEATEDNAGPSPECNSYSGKPLYAKVADSAAVRKSDSIISVIRQRTEWSEEDFIDVGRQLVATNRYRLAVENYTEGLSKYPASFKLLRHRGHRFITLRQLDNAIADLTKAEALIRPEPDTWEYDADHKPTATYQHQIWYHIGVYHFLKRSYADAATAFEKSLAATSKKNDGRNIAGATDWLYNSYQRSGQQSKTAKLLEPITLDFDIDDKDYPYYRRLLLFKGLIKPEDLIDANKPIADMTLLEITKLYALANWYRYRGEMEPAMNLYKKILESKEWPAFAYACAEMDVMEK